MSIKDRLTKKTAGIVQAALDAKPVVDNRSISAGIPEKQSKTDIRTPRTGPGQMLAFRSHMQENSAKVQELEDRLKSFDGALPVRKIDPRTVVASRWSNRHSSSFLSAEFASLRKEIEAAGGNIQPILVRPLQSGSGQYEIVFGHRRHQACLQLGLPILAVIDEISDRELFTAMDRENRARADLSPFEQGEMYRRALDEGLFPSLRMLAVEVGADPGNVSKAISIARLPPDVLAAFQTPTDIQYRWAQLIQKALDKDPDAVLLRAQTLASETTKPPSAEVLDILIGQVRKLRESSVDLRKAGKSLGRIKRATDGSVLISVKPGVLSEASYQRLREMVESIVTA